MAKKQGWHIDTQKDENRSQGLWITYPTYPTPSDFSSFRKRFNISAAAFGVLLGERAGAKNNRFSRSYVKHLEGGSMRITPNIAKAFDELAAEFHHKPAAPHVEKQITIISKFKLRASVVHLNLRPRPCRGHRRTIIMSPTQVYCGTSKRARAECQKIWRRKNGIHHGKLRAERATHRSMPAISGRHRAHHRHARKTEK